MDYHVCRKCGVLLSEPYVKCVECKPMSVTICLRCFAKGQEFADHKNNHAYSIIRNDFPIFGSSWMAFEELKLLDAISRCGLNWPEVAKTMLTRTKTECEKHYLKYYIGNPLFPLPEMKERNTLVTNDAAPIACSEMEQRKAVVANGAGATPIIYYECQNPPRPAVASMLYNELAGYMPARGDFSTEFNDYAEFDLKELEFVEEKDPVLLDLQVAVVNIYRGRLRERARRKCIVRNYGLVSVQKNVEEWRRYNLLGREVVEKMKNLMRLMKPLHFDKFMEGVAYEAKLRSKIKLLQESRKAGIQNLHNMDMFVQLKKKAEGRKRSKTLLDNILVYMKDDFTRQQFFRKQALSENSPFLLGLPLLSAVRRTAPPLIISGLPDYEKLTPKERDLCSALRLYPSSFLQHKATLLHEYGKLGSLRLANARAVIKIDVNKTRKIYNLLLEDGLIQAPLDMKLKRC